MKKLILILAFLINISSDIHAAQAPGTLTSSGQTISSGNSLFKFTSDGKLLVADISDPSRAVAFVVPQRRGIVINDIIYVTDARGKILRSMPMSENE